MFSDILNEIAKKKRNSLSDINQPKTNYVSDTNSKISNDNKAILFIKI